MARDAALALSAVQPAERYPSVKLRYSRKQPDFHNARIDLLLHQINIANDKRTEEEATTVRY